MMQGHFTPMNGSSQSTAIPASFSFANATTFQMQHNIKGTHELETAQIVRPEKNVHNRLFSGSILAVVEAASSSVDVLVPRSHLLYGIVSAEFTIVAEQATSSNGDFLMYLLCR
jgi:hypothetical protein